MQRKTHSFVFLTIVIGVLLFTSTAYSQNNAVIWYSFDMGYAVPQSSNTAVKSVVGQTFVGKSVQASTQVESGFLADTLARSLIVSAGDEVESLPLDYLLYQNYPNPFNPSTTIRYEIPIRSRVVIRIYSILGKEVATLTNELKPAGRYEIVWDGRNQAGMLVSSGVYLYRFQADEFVQTRKLLLIK